MTNIGDRTKEARENLGLTQTELAKRMGVSSQAISQLEGGSTKGVKPENLMALIKILEVSPDWLVYGKGPKRLNHNNNVTPVQKKLVLVPIISWVMAGSWTETIDNHQPGNAEDFVPVPEPIGRHAFALVIQGDSMEPEFTAGDIVVVDPDQEAKHGSFVIVRLDNENEATFKQLIVDGGKKFLKPLNPRYPILTVSSEATICGVVCFKMKGY